jgi:hypothetical protein
MDLEAAEQVKDLLLQEIDWEHLIFLARKNWVTPLLYWNLNNVCPDAIPADIFARLQAYFYANAQYNLSRTRELIKFLDLFETQETPVISFKGPVLATSIYGNLSLRAFSDLDLLVRQQDAPKAKDLLLSLGYQVYKPRVDGHTHSEPTCTFIRNDMTNVDLHWGLTRSYVPFPIDLEYLKDRLTPVYIGGTPVLSPSLEDMLLILCMHGSRHVWTRLEWICDVAELLRVHQGMDWRWVMEQARKLGSERMLFLGLLLASDLLGAAIPDEVMQKVRAHPNVNALASRVQERLFSESDESNGVVQRFVFRIRVREGLQDNIANVLYLIRRTFTPNEKDRMLIPVLLLPSCIYYLIRPFRLVGVYGIGLLRRTMGVRGN